MHQNKANMKYRFGHVWCHSQCGILSAHIITACARWLWLGSSATGQPATGNLFTHVLQTVSRFLFREPIQTRQLAERYLEVQDVPIALVF